MQRYSLYPHLYKMDLCSPENEYNICLTNGRLSFANPNYHLDPARLEQGLNSSLEEERRMYQEWFLKELEEACSLTNKSNSRKKPESRLSYALLDIYDMGVDLNGGPIISFDLKKDKIETAAKIGNILDEKLHFNGSTLKSTNKMTRRSLDLTNSSVINWSNDKPDLIENTTCNLNGKKNTNEKVELSTLSQNKPLLNTALNLTEYLNKKDCTPSFDSQFKLFKSSHNKGTLNFSTDLCNVSPKENLPPEWEKHEDKDGPYYWHTKSGIIQRDSPCIFYEEINKSLEKFDKVLSNFQNTENVSSQLVFRNKFIEQNDNQEKRKKEIFLKRRSYPTNFDLEYKEQFVRFAVRSLGWVEISEDDLTPERSSKAVNKCIVDLSLGVSHIMDTVGRWGDGKDLFMDLDEGSLKLIDPENLTILNTQPIHTIRVWGVGRDNGRDFAYVARDRISRKHMCHVFRCDIAARTIANTLRDICKKIMIERSLQQNLIKTFDNNNKNFSQISSSVRPTSLPVELKRNQQRNCFSVIVPPFPTPMEEPKKIIEVLYLGSVQVLQASGMNILNDAISILVAEKERSEWIPVNVAIAPSTITISTVDDNKVIIECRVRYLSFLGIGKDVKQCAFIMHTAQDIFVCHVFHCEPSSGSLCKTIEAACKLRYQKCLDAHPSGLIKSQSIDNVAPHKSISSTLKSFVGSITGRKVNASSNS